MSTSSDIFNAHVGTWIREQDLPWQQLKYRQMQANLARHLTGPSVLLDAGGGNGTVSLPLAQQGHTVTIVDYSTEMLAEANRQVQALNLQERVTTKFADLQDLPNLFPTPRFQTVLCHNVIPYIDDVPAFLKMLTGCLLPGGLLSLVSLNRYSQVYRAALPQGSLAEALAQLNAPTGHSLTFDTTLHYYDAETMVGVLEEAGYVVEAHYGIHCLCAYWGTNDLKFDPAIMNELERLEMVLADQHPYKLLARFFHILARKP